MKKPRVDDILLQLLASTIIDNIRGENGLVTQCKFFAIPRYGHVMLKARARVASCIGRGVGRHLPWQCRGSGELPPTAPDPPRLSVHLGRPAIAVEQVLDDSCDTKRGV